MAPPPLRFRFCALLAFGWGVLALPSGAAGQSLEVQRVAGGLERPVHLCAAPGDEQRLFVCEQHAGRVRVVKGGELLEEPFLDVGHAVSSIGPERGLLALAFHPDYQECGRFFISYTDLTGTSVIGEYAVSEDPDRAAPDEVRRILELEQPSPVHNGNALVFGPDGMLYYSAGDGGPGNDPENRAQDGRDNHGKILRLDVDAPPPFHPPDNPFLGDPAVNDEVWALGLRNPWRFSFDRETGDLWIGDVGEFAREEINFASAADAGGRNYGWRCLEGTKCTGLSGCDCTGEGLVPPLLEYSHLGGDCAVIGGHVYRGALMPELSGTYFYADWCSARVWSLRYQEGEITEHVERTAELQPEGGTLGPLYSFGEDAAGELYLLDGGAGVVYRLVPACGTAAYCSAAPNSVGPGAVLSSTGGTSLAGNDLHLHVSGAVPQEAGLFFYGPRAVQLPYGDGVLCVGPGEIGLVRLGPVTTADGEGHAERAVDLLHGLPLDHPARIRAGSTWYFQYWYRDPVAAGAGFNFSDALRASFCP